MEGDFTGGRNPLIHDVNCDECKLEGRQSIESFILLSRSIHGY
jgi:hypothetical protein